MMTLNGVVLLQMLYLFSFLNQVKSFSLVIYIKFRYTFLTKDNSSLYLWSALY